MRYRWRRGRRQALQATLERRQSTLDQAHTLARGDPQHQANNGGDRERQQHYDEKRDGGIRHGAALYMYSAHDCGGDPASTD
jgi:hypothetical protein